SALEALDALLSAKAVSERIADTYLRWPGSVGVSRSTLCWRALRCLVQLTCEGDSSSALIGWRHFDHAAVERLDSAKSSSGAAATGAAQDDEWGMRPPFPRWAPRTKWHFGCMCAARTRDFFPRDPMQPLRRIAAALCVAAGAQAAQSPQTPIEGSGIPQFIAPLPTLGVAGGSMNPLFGTQPLRVTM